MRVEHLVETLTAGRELWVEGVATDGERVRTGGHGSAGVRGGHSHLQKRGRQQPAGGRQTGQYQAIMHRSCSYLVGCVMQGGRVVTCE